MRLAKEELEKKELDEAFWQDINAAQKILKEKTQIASKIAEYENLTSEFQDNKELSEIITVDDTEEYEQLLQNLEKLYKNTAKFATECLFSDKHDTNNCFLEINSGAGGTESNDWSEILLRMYLKFVEKLKFKSEIISLIAGEEAGVKSVLVKIKGFNSYGWFRTESGVHRLVRISPFNSLGKRMTSFSSVNIYPEIKEDNEIIIENKDIRIDTYRSSGAGGQHVNTTDSAVRITHIPTNIVVQCQNNKSQHKNKEEALKILKSRIYNFEQVKKEAELKQQYNSKTDIGWGHQIRSYVLHPYRMVKDLRTNIVEHNVDKVLNGELENFVFNNIAHKVK